MKKIIVLAALLFVGLGYGQVYKIETKGTSKVFFITDTINNVSKSYLGSRVLFVKNLSGNIDIFEILGVDYRKPIGFPKAGGIPYTQFVDSNNATFASAEEVELWGANNVSFSSAGGSASSTDFGDEIVYLTDYDGSNAETLQNAIDALEALDGGSIWVNKQINLGSSTVYISGLKPITLIGTGIFAQILCGEGSGGIVIGSESTATSRQINFSNIRIYGADYYGTNLTIINHRRFNAIQSSFSGNVNGAIVKSYGNGGYTYDINFTNCEFESNQGYGVHVLSEYDGAGSDDNFANHVSFTGCYITDNGINVKLEKEANTGEVGSVQFANCYIDNGDNSNVNLQMIGVNNCRFSNVTFDGALGGVDQITLDSSTFDNTFTSCSFDGNVSNLGTRNSFNGNSGITFFNSSRNVGISDIGRSVFATVDGTYTLTADFNSMITGQEIQFVTQGKTVTIQAATGVYINGVISSNIVVGDGINYLHHIIKKVGNNSFNVYSTSQGLPGIIAVTSSRNIAPSDIKNTLACTTTATLTITSSFTEMKVGQTINLEAHGTTFTILGGSGVTVNGVSTGSKAIGDGSAYVGGVLRKTGTNSYVVF